MATNVMLGLFWGSDEEKEKKEKPFGPELVELERTVRKKGMDIEVTVSITNVSKMWLEDLRLKLDVPPGFHDKYKTCDIELGDVRPTDTVTNTVTLHPSDCMTGRLSGTASFTVVGGRKAVVDIPPKVIGSCTPYLAIILFSETEFAEMTGALEHVGEEVEVESIDDAVGALKKGLVKLNIVTSRMEKETSRATLSFSGREEMTNNNIFITVVLTESDSGSVAVITVWCKDLDMAGVICGEVRDMLVPA
jgi:hypothetical protein